MWARSSLCCLPRTRQAYILRTPSKVVDTGIDYDSEKVHYWRDTLRHPCHPLEEHMQFWPEKPPHYRYVWPNMYPWPLCSGIRTDWFIHFLCWCNHVKILGVNSYGFGIRKYSRYYKFYYKNLQNVMTMNTIGSISTHNK